ncbi:MAG: DUF5684 domain-containing protein [Vulcanimicrobiota bacterium]
MENGEGGVIATGMFCFTMIIGLGVYAFTAYSLQTIAQKTDTENGWLAWIPIANIYLMCMIAGRPIWWLVLCFLPVVNVIVMTILWMDIAEVRGRPNWWGILVLWLPLIQFYFLYAMAFQDA